jgi:hypothetical protein
MAEVVHDSLQYLTKPDIEAMAVYLKSLPGRFAPAAAPPILWAWTAVGAAIEILAQLLPAALGLTTTINAGLARVLFSWTLHAIVYFWLIPSYIAYSCTRCSPLLSRCRHC